MVLLGVKFPSMTNTTKVCIGVGVVAILAGAVFLWLDSAMWASVAYLVLFGIYSILLGMSFSLGGVRQKVTRRLSFGFLGATLVFLGIGLATIS
jgi:purine-cytosine permease-like protein